MILFVYISEVLLLDLSAEGGGGDYARSKACAIEIVGISAGEGLIRGGGYRQRNTVFDVSTSLMNK